MKFVPINNNKMHEHYGIRPILNSSGFSKHSLGENKISIGMKEA